MQVLHSLALLLCYAAFASSQTCDQIASCIQDLSQLGETTDMAKMCQTITAAMQCVQQSYADCQKKGMGDDASATAMVQQMEAMQPQLQSCSAVSPGQGVPTNPTCDQMMACLASASDLAQVGAAAGNQSPTLEQMQEYCGKIKEIVTCAEIADQDCVAKGLAETESHKELKSSLMNFKSAEGVCGGSGANGDAGASSSGEVPSNPKCGQLRACMSGLDKFQGRFPTEKSEKDKACMMLPPRLQCMKTAIADCETSGAMPKDALDGMKEAPVKAQELYDANCPAGGAGGDVAVVVGQPDSNDKTGTYNTGASSSDELPSNPTCTQMAACAAGFPSATDFPAEKSEQDEACKLFPPRLECMKKVVASCESNEAFKNMVAMTRQSVETANKIYTDHCERGGAGVNQISWMIFVAGLLASLQFLGNRLAA